MSRPAWKADAFWVGVLSKEFPRLRDFGVRVLFDLDGVFLGDVKGLRVEEGGGMRSASMPLLPNVLQALGVGSGVDAFFVGDANILANVESSCGTFSLSSSYRSCTSMISLLVRLSAVFALTEIERPTEDFHCLLGLRLWVSTSVRNGELGGPSQSMKLGSTS